MSIPLENVLNQDGAVIENHVFDEITLGQEARSVRTLTLDDIRAFAAVTGDTNPAHLDAGYAESTPFHGVIAHGMWGGSLISAVLGTQFPGPGTIYLEQALHFRRPVRVGDTLTTSVRVVAKDAERKQVTLDCDITNQQGDQVLRGSARVLAPTRKVRHRLRAVPTIQLFDPQARLQELIALSAGLAVTRCAVVHPCDAASLQGALECARLGIMHPLLVGPPARIAQVAEEAELDLGGCEIEPVAHSHAAAQRAAELAASGAVDSLMKGSLHTDELMHAVLAQRGLRTGRRCSHVFRFDVPSYHKPLLLTDAALNIAPSLAEKVDIVQNAIEFSCLLGTTRPKVAILSAVETVSPSLPSSLDAAALCKMADRGQIVGGVLDGPLGFDNAISEAAARIKGIDSPVAGDADVLLVPDLESGNMLAKQLEYLGGAMSCGVVLGAKVPIALTSRADGTRSRIGSAVLARLVAHHNRMVGR